MGAPTPALAQTTMTDTTTISDTTDPRYRLTFQATGCSNSNPRISWWQTVSDERVWRDMYTYCSLAANGTGNKRQVTQCCGSRANCKPTCVRQNSWVEPQAS